MEQKTMGAFLAALRKANGITQQELADRLNVSNKAVSRWERDECMPDLSLIPALAEIFGVTCDELLKGERIFAEKSEPKVEKQVKALINRSIANFKILLWISLALSVIGLVCMFGISYGFYRPIVYLLKFRAERRELLLPGIRNALLILPVFLIEKAHNVTFVAFGDGRYQRYDDWNMERIWLVLFLILAIFALSKLIESVTRKKLK